ncbi:putative toxin-antitoxin system toxin component, PIN family [Leptospira sarikeiensis]|uniref:Putative toxin-antitoxin system toxin component, PIN family n=1 Tax=Leptospira sarikeiensis TaxID=2484943 RepID=A0A4R9KA90_9LEPT|nr:putative toxin-antitoxin system toxin component, PIN family [Leptospira sarikeiensis]TGL62380.1 putative toxin-antitoxin system toxin component, PIN family [Leptospira sarikeiensis]
MKIVLDTNVLLSSYLFQGYTAEVFDHIWLNHEIIVSEWIFAEFKEVCSRKFKIPEKEIRGILDHLRGGSVVFQPKGNPPKVCIDPDDDQILHVAEFSKADWILSGDSDLLKLKKYQKIEIISPREYKLKFLV